MSSWSIKSLLRRVATGLHEAAVEDMEPAFLTIWSRCRPFTMTSIERGYAFYKAVEYVSRHRLPGDIVECGVWRGGSAMIAALTLLHIGDTSRTIYLYDTYAGMVQPTDKDVNAFDVPAADRWRANQRETHNAWCYAPRAEVDANLRTTGYPAENLRFVEGKVEKTIPAVVPDEIAVLRLDTDWFESTYHELRELYPLLVRGGVLIIDDYGAWKGSREATDRYLAEHGLMVLLNRIDMTGRVAVKP